MSEHDQRASLAVDAPAPKRGRLRGAIVAFIVSHAAHAIAIAVWIPLAWGLRGSTYEPGRPTPEDIVSMHVLRVVFGATLALDAGMAIVGLARRRWEIAAGVAAAWVTIPLAYVLGLVLDAIVLRAWGA